MKKQKKLVLIVILIAVLLMGIGYAALSNVTLTINGTASAVADNENFKVYFTGESTPSTTSNVTTTVTAKSVTADVEFSGLTKKDDEEYVIFEIENGSNDVDAKSVTVTLTSEGSDKVLEAKAIMCDSTGTAITDYAVASGSKTYVKVSAKLLQTPTENADLTITATITAVAENVVNSTETE